MSSVVIGVCVVVILAVTAAAARVLSSIVEDSEPARARLGAEVVVLEHPDDPIIRTLDGFGPHGDPLTD